MGFFAYDSDQANAYEEVTTSPPGTELSHESIVGAAAYEASNAWDKYVAAHGTPDSDDQAKELLAAVTSAFVDRVIETRGLVYIDVEKAKNQARQHAEDGLATVDD